MRTPTGITVSLRSRVIRWGTRIVSALFLLMSSQALAQEAVPGEIIIKLKGHSRTMKSQAFIGKVVSENGLNLKTSLPELNMHHFKINSNKSVEQTLAELKNDPDVEYAEPNYILKLPDTVAVPGDGDRMTMQELYGQVSSSGAIGTFSALAQTNAPIQLQNAWTNMASSAAPIVVAVIDTGVDYNHAIFTESGAIWSNPGEIAANGIDDDSNGYIDDVRGWNFVGNNNNPMDDDNHGTHVSGIILGTGQDISSHPLHAAAVRIMPLKFLDSTGSGNTADAVKAIYYAVNNGAKVLNNSWGGSGYSQSLVDAIAYAYSRRAVFVAAAGNAANNNDVTPTYPANYSVPGVISVAATSDADGFASFSNYGAQTVHVGAPGLSIWSSLPNNFYGRASGTSMATPFVSGLAALMLRENSNLSAYQIKQLLISSGDKISSLQTKTTSQARIDAYNSILAAKSAVADTDQPAFTSSASREVASTVDVAGCGVVKKLTDDGDGPGGANKTLGIIAMALVLSAPLVIAMMLRNANGKSRRRFPRYSIDSSVRLKIGDRELVGNVNSISMGGVALQTDAWLENGGVVTMSIRSPDGNEEIQVGGKIVWSEEKKRYGVAFERADSSVLNSIGRWTSSLMKAS